VRVLIDYRSALRARSGVGEYVHQLVAALIALRHAGNEAQKTRSDVDLTIFSSSWKDRLRPSAELDGTKAVDLRIPVAALNLAWHRFGWPPAELLARGQFDVTHSLHPLLMPARAAAQVITIHDLNFLAHPERTRGEIRRDYPALAREHAHRADAIIVPSRFTAGEVERQLGVAADRIAVCSPGAPPWRPRAAAPRDGYVLFFGTLEPRKNVGTLLMAYEQLLGRRRMPELVLAGQATAESRSWLEQIARPPLAGRVRHIGYVDPANRRELYAGARLLVQPSFEEGFGIPVLEAMTIGVPVVAAGRGALPEVLGSAGLFFDPDRAEDLAVALERMVDDERFSAACAAAGVERSGRFAWTDTAVRVVEVYQQAIERRAHAHRR
jgi:glycosyltransferase involved in cell wall biosynthesis